MARGAAQAQLAPASLRFPSLQQSGTRWRHPKTTTMSLSSCLPNPCLFLLVYVGGGVGSAPPPLLVLQPPDHHAKQEKVRLHRIGSEESALREASTKRDEGSGSQSSDRSLEKQRRKQKGPLPSVGCCWGAERSIAPGLRLGLIDAPKIKSSDAVGRRVSKVEIISGPRKLEGCSGRVCWKLLSVLHHIELLRRRPGEWFLI